MDYHYFKDIINRFYARRIGAQNRPTFFDISTTVPALNEVTAQFPAIKAEFERVLELGGELPRYHDIDPGEKAISDTSEKRWNVFMIYLLGYRTPEGQALCPTVNQLVSKIPHVIQAFFSILDPEKSVPLHEGPYLVYLRYHLGIQIPKENPPHIIVNQQSYVWKEGEAVLFDDSWPHEVKNESQTPRAVLIIDVMRPMPWLPHKVNQIMTKIIARLTYGRSVMKRVLLHGKSVKPLMQ